MPDIQKKLCQACGQANDYSSQHCSFCAAPLSEDSEDQAQHTAPSLPAQSKDAVSHGLTNKELQGIAEQERSTMPTPTTRRELRLFLIALVVAPLVIIVLLALLGGLAKLSDFWRVGG